MGKCFCGITFGPCLYIGEEYEFLFDPMALPRKEAPIGELTPMEKGGKKKKKKKKNSRITSYESNVNSS